MATPTTTATAQMSGDTNIDALITGYKWNLTEDRTIDWSISNGWGGEEWQNKTYVYSIVNSIFNTYSLYANVKFNYLGYFTSPLNAYGSGSEINVSIDKTYNEFTYNQYNVYAHAYYPQTVSDSRYAFASGDMWLNYNYGSISRSLPSFDVGSQGYLIFLHELGHSLGLKDTTKYSSSILNELDSDYFTIMSYNDYAEYNKKQWDPATPMILDVLALQYMYGKNTSNNIGDTSYTLTQSNVYKTYWDAGGTDTVSVYGTSVGWTVILPDNAISTLVDTRCGMAVPSAELVSTTSPAKNVNWLMGDMENITGSSYSDGLVGNQFNNSLIGNEGNDLIYGKAGMDVIYGNSGNDTLSGNEGSDVIYAGVGDDFVSGGKEGDTIYGDTGKDLIYGNFGNDTIYAQSGDDTIRGGWGFDSIDGGYDDDRIYGMDEGDTLTGGPGCDTFVYTMYIHSDLNSMDTITDFTGGTDKIDISLFLSQESPEQSSVQSLVDEKSKLSDALDACSECNSVDGGVCVFTYANNTYLFRETIGENTSYDANDFLVKITGTTSGITFSNDIIST